MKLRTEIHVDYNMSYDGDPWGNLMGWWFAVADYLTFETAAGCPDSWRFHPSPMGANKDSFEYELLIESQLPLEEAVHFGNVLERLSNIHKAAGRDY